MKACVAKFIWMNLRKYISPRVELFYNSSFLLLFVSDLCGARFHYCNAPFICKFFVAVWIWQKKLRIIGEAIRGIGNEVAGFGEENEWEELKQVINADEKPALAGKWAFDTVGGRNRDFFLRFEVRDGVRDPTRREYFAKLYFCLGFVAYFIA